MPAPSENIVIPGRRGVQDPVRCILIDKVAPTVFLIQWAPCSGEVPARIKADLMVGARNN